MWLLLLALVRADDPDAAFDASYTAQAAAAEVGAQGLAEQAQQAERTAKTDQIEAAHAAPEGQVAQAEYAVKHAGAAEGTAEVLAKSAVAKGVARADVDTHAALGDLFKKFEDWRFSVLHPAEREARLHAEKAAEPYIDALGKTEKRIEDLQHRAEGLSNQAGSLRNIAVGTANLAVAKQAAVDLKGAAADMMNAHRMMAQANDFDTQAGKLQLQAQGLQLNVPGYQAAAQMATSYSGWRYNPDGRPPPPVPAFGFTPPPPPINLAFLERKKTPPAHVH